MDAQTLARVDQALQAEVGQLTPAKLERWPKAVQLWALDLGLAQNDETATTLQTDLPLEIARLDTERAAIEADRAAVATAPDIALPVAPRP